MSSSTRTALALLLTLALAPPPDLPAQEPAAAPEQQPAAERQKEGVTGSWEGWARLTNDWPDLRCRYESGPGSTAVRLEMTGDAGRLRGSVAIDLPAEPGSGCPPLRKRYLIGEASTGEGTLAFTDSGGNEWTLAVRRSGSVLQGMLAWRTGGAEQPLAEGFSLPGGARPQARLSGEVRLTRSGGAEEQPGTPAAGGAAPTPAGGAAPAAPRKTSLGRHLGNVAIVLGANAVALGLLYGVNRIGKGTASGGTATCSPRMCDEVAGGPCYCPNVTNIVNNGPCGTTPGGVKVGATCSEADPCEVGLSCNKLLDSRRICQDNAGRCPW